LLFSHKILFIHTVYLNGVTLEQNYIQAYRLIIEVMEIKNIPDPLAQGVAMQLWIEKASEFVDKISQPCSRSLPALNLVKTKSHPPQQNCDDVSHSA